MWRVKGETGQINWELSDDEKEVSIGSIITIKRDRG